MTLQRSAICAVALGLALASPAWATITVALTPAVQSVDIADPSVAVNIVADIPQADAIIHWGLDLDFDNLVVDLSGGSWASAVSVNTALFNAATAPDGDALTALVAPAASPLWGDDLLLATVTFVPAGLGTTALTLSDDNGTGDLTEGFSLNPPPVGAFADVTYIGGQITVTPEPGTLALIALGGLVLIRRR
ncbi:MAG: PEP-CTERM sorting domain-containing protein [Phycisphaerales bacterium]|nr:PEP-CTERM sorting domain-containing protein [Phycisphaerales bacterium]